MSKKISLFTVLLVVVALGAAVGLYAYNKQEMAPKQSKQAPPKKELVVVSTIPVERVPVFYSGFKENGTIEAVEHVVLRSKINGRLEKMLVKEGEQVQTGQKVAIIEHDSITARLSIARADLAVAMAELEQARVTLTDAQREAKRYEKLFKDGYCTEQQLTERRTTLRTAEAGKAVVLASIARNKASIREIQVELDEATIVAPIEGVVADDYSHTPGEMITGDSPIVELISTDRVYARVNVAEQDAHRIYQGMPANLSLIGDRKGPYTGKIWRIQPTVDTSTRTTRVDVMADDPSAMRPGMFAGVFFIEDQLENPAVMPAIALKEQEGESYLWLKEGKYAKRRPVNPGLENGNLVAIAEAFPQNARIMVSGTDHLKDGDLVFDPKFPEDEPIEGLGEEMNSLRTEVFSTNENTQ